MDLQRIIMTIVVLAGVLAMYFGTYILNKRIPVPEGTDILEECNVCNTTSCANHPDKITTELREFYISQKEKPECDI